MSKVIGIDLGTTNSCIAVMEGGEPIVIPNSEGARTTPSTVAFAKNGERLVGQAAKRQAVTNPSNTVFSAKRLIGRKHEEVSNITDTMPYKVVPGKNGDAYIEVEENGNTESFAPEQISAMILQKLKADAEAYLGEDVTQAVITVPAYFNDAQRQATKDAGKIAGLDVLRIINEPTAASLAYGLEKKEDQTIAVFDLGGGTFDISVLDLGDGVFEVKATNGDNLLGGDDWDEAVINWLCDEFNNEQGIDLRNDQMAMQRLKEEAEKAKVALSSAQSTDINLPFITANESGPKHLQVNLTRSKLEQICEGLYDRVKIPFKACVKDSEVSASEIDHLILVGGMTRSPRVVELAHELTGKEPHQGVNPDEVVAIGAAIQGAILTGDSGVSDVLLLDVTPLTLGIETAGGISTPMIDRNTTIPTKKTNIFSTYADNQTAVDIKILQGERQMSVDNKMLGTFKLDGIPPAQRGVPQVEVTFDIDANGILNVAAKDLGSGKDQKITISGSSGLDQDEVDRLQKEAAKHAEEDEKRKAAVESRNELDNLIYQSEKQLKENGEKISSDNKARLESTIEDAKKTLENQDAETTALKAEKDRLMEVLNKVGEEIHSAASATEDAGVESGATPDADAASSGEPTTNAPSEDDVVDADFEVVEDEKTDK
ncbi:MAG: molecular chaperone DnaK [Opitutae bacterium]|jgi:molecular chaperone DnaK|nr:molecular chaperone DnaK [Opitutae bacterium]